MKKGGVMGSKAARKNKAKGSRVMGKYKGRGDLPTTLDNLDLSCILDPLEDENHGVALQRPEEEKVAFTRKGGLYLSGGRTVTRDSHFLREFDITAVLNASDNVLYKSVEGLPKCRSHHLPLRDFDSNNSLAPRDVQRAMEFIEAELEKGCVLVHCRGGVNRSAGLVVLYVMRKHGWSWRDAHEWVTGRRDINIHRGLERTLNNIAYSLPTFFVGLGAGPEGRRSA